MNPLDSESVGQPIVQAARQALQQHAVFRGRAMDIRMDEHDGRLVLHGRLPSFYLKSLLQSALRTVEGVREIDNRVEVFGSTR